MMHYWKHLSNDLHNKYFRLKFIIKHAKFLYQQPAIHINMVCHHQQQQFHFQKTKFAYVRSGHRHQTFFRRIFTSAVVLHARNGCYNTGNGTAFV